MPEGLPVGAAGGGLSSSSTGGLCNNSPTSIMINSRLYEDIVRLEKICEPGWRGHSARSRLHLRLDPCARENDPGRTAVAHEARMSSALPWGLLDVLSKVNIEGMVVAQPIVLSEAGYLALEAAELETRHELWDGELRVVAGTSLEHNDLVFEVRRVLADRVRGGPCRVFSESVRARLGDLRYVYPDVVVACPPEVREAPRPVTLLNPRLVLEVLSGSTADFDRGRKLRGYQKLASVEQVVLLDSEHRYAEHHVREPEGIWRFRDQTSGVIDLGPPFGALELDPLFDAAGVHVAWSIDGLLG